MSPLADLQTAFATAVLGGDAGAEALPAFRGSVPPAAAFSVHRGTVLGALTGALRLTYPTVDSLVGATFFDAMALEFIATEPPSVANLSAYGDGLPAFLSAIAPAAQLPYLADVAAFDLAIDRVQRAENAAPRQFAIDPTVALAVSADLRVLALDYPADQIRDAVEAGDERALSAIEMTAARRWIAVWRSESGSSVRGLSAAPAAFLRALLNGRSVDQAFALTAPDGDTDAALAAIQAEVFTAPFATIIPLTQA